MKISQSNDLKFASPDSVLICTLFDQNYLTAGMSMIQSVLETSDSHLQFIVLALDNETFEYLTSLNRNEVTPIKLSQFLTEPLKVLQHQRNWREFCWTLPAYFLEYVLESAPDFNYIAYVDSDCYFFSDISFLCKELSSSESVLIHPHRFPNSKRHMEFESGVYNVGVILGRTDVNFLKVVKKWRKDVTVECILDPTSGKCGDQTYLNDWPKMFDFVKIAQNHGIGAGPWNIESSTYTFKGKEIFIDGHKLVFYHFSRFKPIYISKFINFAAAAPGYFIPSVVKTNVYKSYLKSYSKEYSVVGQYLGKNIMGRISYSILGSFLKHKQVVVYLNFRLSLLGRLIKVIGIPK